MDDLATANRIQKQPIDVRNVMEDGEAVGVEEKDGKTVDTGRKDEETVKAEEEIAYKTGVALWTLVMALLLVVIMVTLDISILATAIPRITDDFHTIADIGWYPSAFLTANCALQPFAGRIYSFFPFKPSFLGFVCIFELGSLLSGVAVSSTMLIIGRTVCGIGSSGLINGSMTIIGIAAPPSKRSVMMGLFMSIASAGQVIGPLIGGSLTQYVSWRWCFYINLPIGGAAVVCFLFVKLPSSPGAGKDYRIKSLYRELDLSGFVLFAPASVMLLMALEWGGTAYPWNSATVLGLLCGSTIVFVLFLFWEQRQGEHAMIPASVMRTRVLYSSCLTSAFQGASMLILTYYLALWFQVIDSKTPTMSAVSTLPSFLSQVLLALISSFLVSKMRYVLPSLLLGNLLVTVSYGLFSTFDVNTSMSRWIGYQVLAGAGRGMSIQIPMLAVQASVEMSRVATVTALVAWSQFLGSAVSIALSQTLFQNLLRSALQKYAPQLNAGAIIAAGATGFVSVVPLQDQDSVRQAYNQAITQTYYLGIGVAGASLFAGLLIGTTKVQSKNSGKAES